MTAAITIMTLVIMLATDPVGEWLQAAVHWVKWAANSLLIRAP